MTYSLRPARYDEFTKAELERMIIAGRLGPEFDAGYELSGDLADQCGHDCVDTRFGGELPGEVKSWIEGRPGRRWWHFRTNVPGGLGEDCLMALGDQYFHVLEEMDKRDVDRALPWADGDPARALWAFIYRRMPKRQTGRKPWEILENPGALPAGSSFRIRGALFEVYRGEWATGARVVEDPHAVPGGSSPDFPLWAEKIPIDAGSLKVAA